MKLFLTVGSQLPFDRLAAAMDTWVAERDVAPQQVFGQIGPLRSGNYRPAAFSWTQLMDPKSFNTRFAQASHIVAHAGMGTIISALVGGKPIVLLPRRGALRETRNDHQMATIRRFRDRAGVWVAETEEELPEAIDQMLGSDEVMGARLNMLADPDLTNAIRHAILA